MFELLFRQIQNIHFHTQILELCEWDEKKTDELISKLCEALEKMSLGGFDYNISLKENLSISFENYISESEIDIVTNILEEALGNAIIDRVEINDYEN
jgi:phosphoribosylformylglycinamidine (FGAM) synthase PurS component